MPTVSSIEARHAMLKDAQAKAGKLFQEVEDRGLIRAGVTEKCLNEEVYSLAAEMYGIKKYWHKRIVRAGINTLCPYKENPPDLTIKEDDILFLDFGPIFEDWEADLGRTYVIGNDPMKIKLRDDVLQVWNQGKVFYDQSPEITGQELYSYVSSLAAPLGWSFGQQHCGHLIGNFPHENIRRSDVNSFLHPENLEKLKEHDENGEPRDWILEVHLVDEDAKIGAFFEQLLSV